MKNLLIQIQCTEVLERPVQGFKSLIISDSEVFESRFTTIEEAFKDCQKEYGRCAGKVFVGDKHPKQIGWTFEKRVKYTDSDDTYLQRTWVTLHTAPAKKVIEYSPMYIGEG